MNESMGHTLSRMVRVLILAAATMHVAFQVQAQDPPTAAPPRPELLPLPQPDLSQMKAPIRDILDSLAVELAAYLAREDAPQTVLAEAFGGMGEYYQAHSLLDAAAQVYRNAVALAPEEPRWRYLLSIIHEDQHRYQAAADGYGEVLALQPDNVYAMGRLGHVYLLLGEVERAWTTLQNALELDPLSPMVLEGLGLAAAARDEPKAAVTYLERVLDVQPGADSLYYPLGLAYRKLGDPDKARACLAKRGEGKVRYLDPYLAKLSDLVTLSTLQVALAMAADRETAAKDFMGYVLTNLAGRLGLIEYLTAAYEDKTEKAEASSAFERARLQYALGTLLAREGSVDEARAAFRRAMELAPDVAEPYLELGFLQRQTEDWDGALATYDALLARDADHRTGRLDRAKALAGKGGYREALALLDALTQEDPADPDPLLERAAILSQTGEVKGAADLYRRLREMDLNQEKRLFVLNNLGLVLHRGGLVDEAASQYRDALTLDGSQVGTRLNLAAAYAGLGRLGEAVAEYEAVVAAEPERPGAWLGLAAALILGKRYREAIERLDSAHRHLPEHLDIAHLLARALAACPDEALRDGTRAAALAEAIVKRDPASSYVETLAMALAQAGRFEEAVSWQQALIDAATEAGQADHAAALARNLARYHKKQHCCASDGPRVLLP